jgi:hypothetical protein
VPGVVGRGPLGGSQRLAARQLAKADKAAREHFTSEDAQATAVALLVGSSVSKVVANFIIGMKRMPVATRMFTDENAAVSWLQHAVR